MNFKKQTPLILSIVGIVAVLYSVVLFVIAGVSDHEAGFWISYAMMMIAFVSGIVSFLLFSQSKTMLKDWFLGIPIVRISVMYIVIEFFVSTIFIALSDNMSWKLPFIVQLIILVIYVVLIVSCFMSKRMIDNTSETVAVKTSNIRMLHADALMLCEMCGDADVKKQFNEFAEMVRFSDPMSADALADLEADIAREVRNAKMSLSCQDTEEALKCCTRAKLLLKERNLKCKVLK